MEDYLPESLLKRARNVELLIMIDRLKVIIAVMEDQHKCSLQAKDISIADLQEKHEEQSLAFQQLLAEIAKAAAQSPKIMNDDHSTRIGGDNNGQAGQTLTNCTNMIQQMPTGEPKELLKKLLGQLEPVRDEMKGKDIKALDEHLLKLTEEAKKPEPDRGALSLSGQGVVEAAETVGKIAGPVLTTVGLLLKCFGA